MIKFSKKPILTIIIPVRKGENAWVTIKSLCESKFKNFQILVVHDYYNNGSNATRNRGFKYVDTEYVLFSDNDIEWNENAIGCMINELETNKEISFCYGSYEMNGKKHCDCDFDLQKLKRRNYISTMTIIRTIHFTGFDESIKRLQDWDLWLSMISNGLIGKYCGKTIFKTAVRNGITFGNNISYDEAYNIVKNKHFS